MTTVRFTSAILAGLLLCGSATLSPAWSAASDGRPITFVVYTKPGGAIDITARLVARIGARHAGVPIVVDNKAGAGGIVAMNHVLRKPADGHTVFGLTSSVLSSAARFRQLDMVRQLDFVAVMVRDYECLITNREQEGLVTFEDIVADARSGEGLQLWAGPGIGGTDHIFAMKTWRALGVKGKWVPYKGGGKAMAALMGKHCTVYVGNPADTRGKDSLRVTAVASPQRYAEYPDAPTFRELGCDRLTGEVLWRGFALKQGTPPAARSRILEILRKVGNDPEWKEFTRSNQVIPSFITGNELDQMVTSQIETDIAFMDAAGFPQVDSADDRAAGRGLLPVLLVLLVCSAGILALRSTMYRMESGSIVLSVLLGLVGLAALVTSRSYVLDRQAAFHAGTVPGLWATLLALLCLVLLAGIICKPRSETAVRSNPRRVLVLLALTAAYISLLPVIGYVVTTFVYLVILAMVMGYKRRLVMLIVVAAWIGFVYLVFCRTLSVPIPLLWGQG